MSKVIGRVSEHMFPTDGGPAVVNVKFFPGNSRIVTAEQLADQLARADAQIASGAVERTLHLDAGLTVTQL